MKLFIIITSLVLSGIAHAEPPHTDYEVVPFSSTAQSLGATGAAGDVLERLIINASAATANKVYLQDGNTASVIVSPGTTPVGVYSIVFGSRSVNGAWKVTTDTSSSVIAVGRFK